MLTSYVFAFKLTVGILICPFAFVVYVAVPFNSTDKTAPLIGLLSLSFKVTVKESPLL